VVPVGGLGEKDRTEKSWRAEPCLGVRHRAWALPTHTAIEASRRFVVNVLGEGQEELAMRFARPSPDKFEGVNLLPDKELPVLEDAIAHFVCDVHERFPGGDHSIFTGLVRECNATPGKRPLVYFQSRFGAHAPRPGVRAAARSARLGHAVTERHRPLDTRSPVTPTPGKQHCVTCPA
jgi:Flavin reductase like domain